MVQSSGRMGAALLLVAVTLTLVLLPPTATAARPSVTRWCLSGLSPDQAQGSTSASRKSLLSARRREGSSTGS